MPGAAPARDDLRQHGGFRWVTVPVRERGGMASDPREHIEKAKRLVAERKHQDAVRALRRALVSRPDDVEARLLLGQSLLALGRFDEVRAEMLALTRRAPHDPAVHRTLGEAYLRSGKVDKAVEALRHALSIDPDDDAARELIEEAGEEPPARSSTVERWFDPELMATQQSAAPAFVEPVTGPAIRLPPQGGASSGASARDDDEPAELQGGPTSVVLDPSFAAEASSTDVPLPAAPDAAAGAARAVPGPAASSAGGARAPSASGVAIATASIVVGGGAAGHAGAPGGAPGGAAGHGGTPGGAGSAPVPGGPLVSERTRSGSRKPTLVGVAPPVALPAVSGIAPAAPPRPAPQGAPPGDEPLYDDDTISGDQTGLGPYPVPAPPARPAPAYTPSSPPGARPASADLLPPTTPAGARAKPAPPQAPPRVTPQPPPRAPVAAPAPQPLPARPQAPTPAPPVPGPSQAAPRTPGAGRRDITEQLDLGQIEEVEERAARPASAVGLGDPDSGELSTSPLHVAAGQRDPFDAAMTAPRLAVPSAPPPPVLPSAAFAAAPPPAPAYGGAAHTGPGQVGPPAPRPRLGSVAPGPLGPVPPFEPASPPFEPASPATSPPPASPGAFAAPSASPPSYAALGPKGEPSATQAVTAARVPLPKRRGPPVALLAGAGAAAVVVVAVVATLVVRGVLAARRAEAVAEAVAAAEADGRAATLDRALHVVGEHLDEADPEARALAARLRATAALEHGREPRAAEATLDAGSDLVDARIAAVYLAALRGDGDAARRAVPPAAAPGGQAAEAARARSVAALAAGDLGAALTEARAATLAAPGAPRHAAHYARLAALAGDAAAALAALDAAQGGPTSPAVRVARAEALLLRASAAAASGGAPAALAADLAAAQAEAAAVTGDLASAASPHERTRARLVAGALALARGDRQAALDAARQAEPPAPAPPGGGGWAVDEWGGTLRAELLAAAGDTDAARAALAELPPTALEPPRRARAAVRVALAAGDLAAAEQAAAALGTGGAAALLRGRVFEARGRPVEARAQYEIVGLDDPAMPEARARLGRLELAAGRAREARGALEPALARAPSDPDVVASFVAAAVALRDYAAAERVLDAALRAAPASVPLLTARADLQLARGDLGGAASTLRAAIAQAPRDVALRVALARALYRAGQAAEARAAAEEAQRLRDGEPGALVVLADLALDDGDVAGATALVERLERAGAGPSGAGLSGAGPSGADAPRLRARLFVATGAGAAAVPTVRALAEAARDPALWVLLGRLHLQAEADREAREAFGRALRLQRDDPDALVGRAASWARSGKLRDAAKDLDAAERALRARPAPAAVRARLEVVRGRLRFESGAFADASARARAALELDPRCADAHLLLANVAIEQGADPVPAFRAAVAAVAPPAEALGRLAVRLERGDEACTLARRYLAAAPGGYDADAVRALAARCP